ncbi:MAG: polysaccharide deacetylase family protein [Dehalococcoidales bacterium]|nr:polysaccharide deacetylase family protein [Dehalococcoidales bacterium]
MENVRYDYSPLIRREPFKLPDRARVAVWVGVNIEHFDIGTTDFGDRPYQAGVPNVMDYSVRDYGNRVGIWRLMETLDKHNIKASVLLNSDVCSRYPVVIEECKKRGWEFLGHGTSNSRPLGGLSEAEERQVIATTLDTITRAVQQRPVGWLGPALQETFNTPDILAENGVKYLCDWCCDDQPFPMKVKEGSLISMPYAQDINDRAAFRRNVTHQQFGEMIKDQFDTLYRDGAGQSRIMCIALHPFLIGQPFRIGYLDKALQYIKGYGDVWFATAREIADWYYENYLGMKLT